MMSLTAEIQEYAHSQGAQLVGFAPVDVYTEYITEVERRFQETGAQPEHFMISPVTDRQRQAKSDDHSFFTRLSDVHEAFPDAKTMIILGVYTYDEAAVYRHTHQELRGKTARIYHYYPVIRQIAEHVAAWLEQRGHHAIHGQHVPLKFVADRMGLGAYGKNGILQTAQYGSYIAFRNILINIDVTPGTLTSTPPPCEGCDRCLKACPTGALYAPYKVNPTVCINPITRRDAHIEPHIRSKMRNWIAGCDICEEVCPANHHLHPRAIDPRAGFDSRHHASHTHLDGLERTPALIPLLEATWPTIIRRNAAITLANIGKGRHEVVIALQEQLESAPAELHEYFTWALQELDHPNLII